MKKLFVALSLALALITFAACAAPAALPAEPTAAPAKAEYRKISAADAKARMDSGDAIIVLDVRTKEEFDTGHIPGAVLLPNETIIDTQPDLLPDLDAEILIYCRSGNRSAQAANKLIAMGYTSVYDFGGIIDWPYDVVMN
ncbi:MAG: rhodanese-like domain-containing protein [Eubacteriales bacterium]